jgi:hypothetical protein
MLFRVGARVALTIAHSGSEFSTIGRVVVRVADQTNRGFGVEFTELASIDRARLEAYLADLVREEKLASFAALRKKLRMRTGEAREAGDSAKDEGTPKYPWQYAVIDAFKSPLDSLPGKIKVAEKAIAARLTDANHADIEEQLALKDALQALRDLLAGNRAPLNARQGKEREHLKVLGGVLASEFYELLVPDKRPTSTGRCNTS